MRGVGIIGAISWILNHSSYNNFAFYYRVLGPWAFSQEMFDLLPIFLTQLLWSKKIRDTFVIKIIFSVYFWLYLFAPLIESTFLRWWTEKDADMLPTAILVSNSHVMFFNYSIHLLVFMVSVMLIGKISDYKR